MRRPTADFLRDGIYELRPSFEGVNYRILYFFSDRNFVVVSHGIVKESEIPEKEIEQSSGSTSLRRIPTNTLIGGPDEEKAEIRCSSRAIR